MTTAQTAGKTSLPGSDYWGKVDAAMTRFYMGAASVRDVINFSTPEENGIEISRGMIEELRGE
jgi:hypothetical protein